MDEARPGTALLTGGLLACGAGVASADDSSIDLTAPVAVSGTSVAVLGDAAATGTTGTAGGSGGDGSTVDVDAPVTVCGTAVGALGDASARCTTAGGTAGGSGSDGSTVDADAPVTACGTGAGVLADASAGCSGPTSTSRAGTPAGSESSGVVGQWNSLRDVPPAGLPLSTGGAAATGFGTSDVTGELAYTGTELELLLLAGLCTLALGLGLTVASRRRLASTVL